MVCWAIKLLLIQLRCNSICIYNHIFVNQIIHLSLLCICCWGEQDWLFSSDEIRFIHINFYHSTLGYHWDWSSSSHDSYSLGGIHQLAQGIHTTRNCHWRKFGLHFITSFCSFKHCSCFFVWAYLSLNQLSYGFSQEIKPPSLPGGYLY